VPAAIGDRKVCSRCQVERSTTDYVRNAQSRDGLHPWCRPCRKASRQAFYATNREHALEQQRWKTVKHRYGVTQEQFDALLAAQGGRCAICGRGQTDSRGARLCIDHDHRCCPGPSSCGECIRGLLCTPCNLAIGYMQDEPARLERAVDYLRKWFPSL
jgi:hypothetical protein